MFDFDKFVSKLEDHSEKVTPYAAALGALIGAIVGFRSDGLGGAILGGLIGAVVAFLILIFISGLIEQVGRFVAMWGIPILVVLAIYLLWGVGKP